MCVMYAMLGSTVLNECPVALFRGSLLPVAVY